jgi:hypothetical protein
MVKLKFKLGERVRTINAEDEDKIKSEFIGSRSMHRYIGMGDERLGKIIIISEVRKDSLFPYKVLIEGNPHIDSFNCMESELIKLNVKLSQYLVKK